MQYEIFLKDILSEIKEENYKDYKIHFAKKSMDNRPLDVFLDSMEDWEYWNRWSKGKNHFNRKYIFSLIQFFPERDTWLFGGIWEITSKNEQELRKLKEKGWGFIYNIKLSEIYQNLVGRLKVYYSHTDRNVRNNMETYYPHLRLKEILPDRFSNYSFPGYKNISLSFNSLEKIFKNDKIEWKTALQIPGVYLLTDTKTGKKYVGQTKSIWGRWNEYVSGSHDGGNVELSKLSKEYIENNFTFTLMEIIPSGLDDELYEREAFWKTVFLTRNPKFGYNAN